MDSGKHPTSALLTMRGITKSFPGVKALKGVDLDVPRAHVLGLVGENGAGKSTLIKILAGAYEADAGTISVDGTVLGKGTVAAIDAGIAVIYQELSLVDDMSVAENLFLGRMPARGGFLSRSAARRQAVAVLEQVGLGDIDPRRRLGDLPLNKRQLVEVAKALVREARILIMDEPTAALQSEDIDNLYAVVRRLREDGLAIVFISHHLEEVFELADSALVVRDGRAVEWRPIADWDEPSIVRAMVARDLDALFPWEEREYGDVVLEVSGVSRPPLVVDASLTVRAGEIVGIGGIAGAGRTELLKAIAGAEPATEGRITVLGKQVRATSPTRALAAGIVYTAEDRQLEGLVLGASISENVALSNLPLISSAGFVNERKKRSLAQRAVERFRVRTSGINQLTGLLSGGNQQKVILARATATNPKVILLDEPTRGIDVGAKAEIYRYIVEMARQGVAVIVVSSELPELLGMADRILVMYRGRIVTDIPRDRATSENVIHWATTGADPS
jgi:ribose transport system ATP-binding protein